MLEFINLKRKTEIKCHLVMNCLASFVDLAVDLDAHAAAKEIQFSMAHAGHNVTRPHNGQTLVLMK